MCINITSYLIIGIVQTPLTEQLKYSAKKIYIERNIKNFDIRVKVIFMEKNNAQCVDILCKCSYR